MEDELARHIGKAARKARLRLGLTQADVAESVGLASEVYGRLERGRMGPRVETLLKLSVALGVSADELLGLIPLGTGPVRQPVITEERSEIRRLLRRVRTLTPRGQRLMAVLAEALASRGQEGT